VIGSPFTTAATPVLGRAAEAVEVEETEAGLVATRVIGCLEAGCGAAETEAAAQRAASPPSDIKRRNAI